MAFDSMILSLGILGLKGRTNHESRQTFFRKSSKNVGKTTHVYLSEYLELVARVVLGAGGILS